MTLITCKYKLREKKHTQNDKIEKNHRSTDLYYLHKYNFEKSHSKIKYSPKIPYFKIITELIIWKDGESSLLKNNKNDFFSNYLNDFSSSGTSAYHGSSSGIRHQWFGVDAMNNWLYEKKYVPANGSDKKKLILLKNWTHDESNEEKGKFTYKHEMHTATQLAWARLSLIFDINQMSQHLLAPYRNPLHKSEFKITGLKMKLKDKPNAPNRFQLNWHHYIMISNKI